jgi:serine/threonine protein kinase
MRALRAAHRQAIVHRDIKPDNILLSEEGRAKLMDFGIARTLGHMSLASEGLLDPEPQEIQEVTGFAQTLALRLTVTGDFLGSPAYAPPEVLKGGEGTPASDRYSFAATAFELLSGQLPHPGSGLTEIIIHILQDPVAIPPDMSPRLAGVFQRALSSDPEDRHTTLPEFMEELIDALPGTAHLRAKLFGALTQEDDGSGMVSVSRFRASDQAPLAAAQGTTGSRLRQSLPVKIDLAEDPVASYLTTVRRRPIHSPEEGTDWGRVLKWVVLLFLLLQLFWWLVPFLARFDWNG